MVLHLTRTEDGVWTNTTEEWSERVIVVSSIDDVSDDVFMGETDWSLLRKGLDEGMSTMPSRNDDIDF